MDHKNDWRRVMQGMTLTPETVAAVLAEQCRHDPELAQQLRDPRPCMEKLLGHKLPEGIRLVAHENTDDTWHLPLPRYHQSETLNEEQLQKIAAGELGYTLLTGTVIALAPVALLGILSAVGAGVYIAVETGKKD